MADLMQVTADSTLIAATTSGTDRVAIPGTPDVQGRAVRFDNRGAVRGYWKSGDSAVTVSIPTTVAPGGCSLLPGAAESFQIPPGHTHIAVISEAGTINVVITAGQGI